MNHTIGQSQGDIFLDTSSGTHALELKLADSFLSRFRGLMLSKPLAPDAGLLITRCTSVHTAFMRQAIDIVYLDSTGQVVKCVPHLNPWRGSFSHAGKDAQGRRLRPTHTLELAAGSIVRLAISVGDRLAHPHWASADLENDPAPGSRSGRQRGSAMIEFTVVGPIITMLGMAILQYCMLFFAKNQINHASFMAARAGSMGNANLETARIAYVTALVPLYGGGQTVDDLATSLAKATADVGANTRIELLNPTKESFDDWNDPALQKALATGSKRVISNSNQAFKDQTIRAASGQSIQDANLIKLRITHGVEPKVPLIANIYKTYLKWLDPKTDAFHTQLVDAGRIPVVTSITLHMQSPAIEGSPVSMPGPGNGGNPVNSGDPPVAPIDPLACTNLSCGSSANDTGDGTGGSGTGGVCTAPVKTTLSADALFAFDKADLQPAGIAKLDELIAYAKNVRFDSADVTGYTDPLGGDAGNLALSRARAQSVRDYLVSHGFPAVPINVIGLGASNFVTQLSSCPASSQAQIDCLAPNRRVIVELKGVK